jgi:hypothetical protein
MRSQLLVLAMVSVAEAAPSSTTFRVLDWSRSRTTQALTTYTLTIDGTAVTLDIATQTYKTAWKASSKQTLIGRSLNRERDLQIDFKDAAGKPVQYFCDRMRVAVAGPTAVRVLSYQGEASGPFGTWSPAALTNVDAMACSRSDGAEPLLFAARTIEHVRADLACCQKPGQSLRFVPTDRSIKPATTGP